MSELPHLSAGIPVSQQGVTTIRRELREEVAMLVESEGDLGQYFELSIFNPLLQAQRFRNFTELKSHANEAKEKADATEEEVQKVFDVEKVEETADRFQKQNYELNSKTLLILRARISAKDTPEEALKKILAVYPDPALADEALDFLIETANPEFIPIFKEAKDRLNTTRGREIRAGRNIGAQAREFAEEGLGSATSLRDLYRDVTGKPREPLKLFEELTEKYPYEKLKSILLFLLHSLGSDLKSKGPSIARGELKRLLDETRSLQGILGVFRFFQSRMRIIERQFSSYELSLPSRMNFEVIAKIFIKFLAERYINPDRIFQTSKLLGVPDQAAAQLIIFTQMREAIKQIAPRYYRNPQHRDELLKAFLDALDKLEDQLEEEEEE